MTAQKYIPYELNQIQKSSMLTNSDLAKSKYRMSLYDKKPLHRKETIQIISNS